MARRSETRLAERGDWGTIEYVVLRSGDCPSEEFVAGLDLPDKAKLARLFQRMATTGHISNPEKFRKERGEIYGFKSFQIRIGCFRVGRKWLLTHGFRKKKNHWPNSELKRAEIVRNEYVEDHPELFS
jgi:hypothetical protein